MTYTYNKTAPKRLIFVADDSDHGTLGGCPDWNCQLTRNDEEAVVADAIGIDVSYILPQTSQHVKFDDAVNTLKDLFGPQQSLFSARYTCMKRTKDPNDDFTTYAGRVNRECAKFKFAECNENHLKCLIFVCDLQSSEDAFIRLKLVDKTESDLNCTIQILADESKRLLNLRHDTKMIENGSPAVHSVRQLLSTRQGQQKVNSKTDTQAAHIEILTRPPPSACRFCGDMHFIKDSPYRYHNAPVIERSGTKKDTAFLPSADLNDSAPPVEMAAQQGRRCDQTQSSQSQISTTTSIDVTPQLKWTINSLTSKSTVHRT
ncbi:hypothetical protein ANCCEY_01839 [Ancylostoma ceylanicum]|nr:hypothetical protein ANCCEY_01839 [Ancylostoma ceylanicum]